MVNKLNKTKVINTFRREELSKAYLWSETRSTFPSRWWIDILVDFFMQKYTKTEIQKIYKSYLPNSHQEKKDNSMHINVLLKKLLISDKQDFKSFAKWSIEQVKQIIINHINDITSQMKKTHGLPNNWIKQIDNWEKCVQNFQFELPIENKTPNEIQDFINRSSKNNNIRLIKYRFREKIHNINNENSENDYNQFIKKKIGKIGEDIVYKLLIKKYGVDNVEHTSSNDKYSPYDFKIITHKKSFFIEVKSSSRLSLINWFISRRELEFYKTHKKQYSLIFVRDVSIEEDSAAIVEEIKNPDIIVDNKSFGFSGQKLIVAPISYKGLC